MLEGLPSNENWLSLPLTRNNQSGSLRQLLLTHSLAWITPPDMHRSVPIQSSLLLIDFFGSVIIWQSDKWLLANDIAPQKRLETFLPSTIEIAITSWLEISGNPCRLHIKLLSRVVLPRPRNRPLSTERKELPHPSPACTTPTTSTVAECQIFYGRIAFKVSGTVSFNDWKL